MKHDNRFKIEWGLSILQKYGSLILEEQLKEYQLTKTQMMFMIHLLNRDGIHQEELARSFKLDRATATRGIKHLEKIGYVTRQVDPQNKRANLLFLTEEGKGLRMVVGKAVFTWLDIITDDMSEEEVAMSIKIIGKMAANACSHLGDDHLAEKFR